MPSPAYETIVHCTCSTTYYLVRYLPTAVRVYYVPAVLESRFCAIRTSVRSTVLAQRENRQLRSVDNDAEMQHHRRRPPRA